MDQEEAGPLIHAPKPPFEVRGQDVGSRCIGHRSLFDLGYLRVECWESLGGGGILRRSHYKESRHMGA